MNEKYKNECFKFEDIYVWKFKNNILGFMFFFFIFVSIIFYGIILYVYENLFLIC